MVNFFLAATTALPWHVHGPTQARSSAHSNHRPTFLHSPPLRAHAAVPAAAAHKPLSSRACHRTTAEAARLHVFENCLGKSSDDDVLSHSTKSIPSPETKSSKLSFVFFRVVIAYLYLMIFSPTLPFSKIDYDTTHFKAPLLAMK